MTFTEINIFGVYVAPLAVMAVVAWLVTAVLRLGANRLGLLRHVWHAPLFLSAIYVIVLYSIVLLAAP